MYKTNLESLKIQIYGQSHLHWNTAKIIMNKDCTLVGKFLVYIPVITHTITVPNHIIYTHNHHPVKQAL